VCRRIADEHGAAEQFSRHMNGQLRKDERSVTVFNSSVENHVEKARARRETAHYYGAYSSLHKLCADSVTSDRREDRSAQIPARQRRDVLETGSF